MKTERQGEMLRVTDVIGNWIFTYDEVNDLIIKNAKTLVQDYRVPKMDAGRVLSHAEILKGAVETATTKVLNKMPTERRN